MSWPMIQIGQFTHVVTKGTTPTKKQGFAESGINYIKAEALNGDSSLDLSGGFYISEDVHQSLKRSILEDGDVLLTIAGANIGKCGIVEEHHLPANTNQAVGIMRVDQQQLAPRFLYYWFKQPQTFRYIQGLNAQAAQPNINLSMLRNIEVPVPSISEQQRIADVIFAYDDLIENNRRRIQLLEQAARLLYKEWFVHLRFPGHEHTQIIDGVPQGWKKKTAFEVMDVLSGGTPKTTNPSYWNGDIPFFTPKDAIDFAYAHDTEKSITDAGLKNCNSNFYPKDTVFITARGTVGKINLAQRPMAMNQSCYALVAHSPVSQQFLYFALVDGVEQFRSRAVGSVFDAIVRDTFKLIPFIVPDEKLITAFMERVFPMLAQMDNLSGQVRSLRKARDLLLPKLMNGEVAV
jgi:type I restriction enzyme S subunit